MTTIHLLTLLLLTHFFSFTVPSLTMMLVWGVPKSPKNGDVNSSLTWDECIDACYQSQPCIKWYTPNPSGFFYNTSVGLCSNDSATLTSLYGSEDWTYWSQTPRSNLNSSNTYGRLDGIRTKACQATPTTAECMSVKGFTFTGPAPDNFDNYNWVTDSSAQATSNDNCIVMVYNGTTVNTDVRSCVNSSPLQACMVFCSNAAWAS
ncbi:unnamed protein product [Caenorhabditis sp. 36 PRJEB53466]|nr:unnamed protein product [Caenorhabditis sp. 36 PRJEB53466]